ncbi:TPA: fimbrial protein [Enterobacter cancerogenus]
MPGARKILTLTGMGTLPGVIMLLSSSLLSGAHAASDTATLNITGRVLANSCTIDASSAVQSIRLPDIGDRDLSGKGRTGGEKAIDIVLKNCGEATRSVIVTASGGADTDDATAFRNTTAAGAAGVGLYFYQTDGRTPFSPDGAIKETSILRPSEDNVLTYKAAYVSTRGEVKAGGFSTVVNLRFDYQ